MANLDQIQLPDNTSHYTKTIFRGETGSTSTSTAFVVTVSGITSLYDGLTVVIKNTVIASASGCTLNVNGTGAKGIWVSYSNVACTTHWGLNQTYLFIYDLTNDRWELQQGRDRDTDSNTVGEYAGIATAGGGNMTQNGLVMQTQLNPPLFASIVTTSSTGTKTKQTCGFIPNGKVLYYDGATLAEGEKTKVSDIWITRNGMNLRYSFNISTYTLPTTAIGKSIYIKCTKNSTDGKLYLADTTWWATDLPTTQDNFYYVFVGQMQSRYQATLYAEHPIYYHDGTKLQLLLPNEFPSTGSDTWRDITVGGTSWKGTGTDTGALNFVQGSNVTLTASGNDLTIAATDTTYTGTGAISVDSSTHVISTTAEANQNAFSNVKIGSTTIAADSKTDTLELAAGSNITLTPDATNDKVTIAATDTTYSDATSSTSGLLSSTGQNRLFGTTTSERAFQQNGAAPVWASGTSYSANSSYVTYVGLMYRCILDHTASADNSPGSSNADTYWAMQRVYALATEDHRGYMSDSDKTKLNAIPTNGYSDWAYISPSNITNISGSAGNQRYLATITVPAHTLRLYDIAVDLTKGADGGQADLVISSTKGATTATGSTPSGADAAFQYTAKAIAPCPATGNFLIKLSTQIRNNTASSKTYQLNLRRQLGGTNTLTAVTRYSQIEYPA